MSTDLRERFQEAAVRNVPPLDVDALLARHRRDQRVRRAASVAVAVVGAVAAVLVVLDLRPVDPTPVIGDPEPSASATAATDQGPDAQPSTGPGGFPIGGLLTAGWESELIVAVLRAQPRNGDIYTLRPDGSELTPIVASSKDEGEAQVSPDGSQVAFTVQDGSVRNLYVANVDGSDVRGIGDPDENEHRPTWTPDSQSIVFYRRLTVEDRSRIWRIDPDGTNEQLLVDDGNTTNAVMSPDGTTMVYSRFEDAPDEPNGFTVDLWVANADGSDRSRLVETPGLKDWGPSWSPDGTRIAFFATDDEAIAAHDIYVIDADGSNLTQLTDTSTGDWGPVWSPDGTRILFTAKRATGARDLFVMWADGSELHRLTDEHAEFGSPSWVRVPEEAD